jgi:hypothetical protein
MQEGIWGRYARSQNLLCISTSSVSQKVSPLSEASQRCSVHDVSVTSLSVLYKVDLHMRVAVTTQVTSTSKRELPTHVRDAEMISFCIGYKQVLQ